MTSSPLPPPVPYPFPAAKLDLHPAYAELRRKTPVAPVRLPDGRDAYLVTRFEPAREVLGGPAFSRAGAIGRAPSARRPEGFLTDLDPPDHTRLRRCISPAFTPRRIRQQRPMVERIAESLLDAMAATGPPADLIQALALPLPIAVIAEMLGVDAADQHQFAQWAEAFLSHAAYSHEQVRHASEAMTAYLAARLDQRRDHPAGDLLSHLAAATETGKLGRAEAVNLAVGLLVAGFETTASQIGNFAYTLVTHPQWQQQIHQHPDLLPTAIEELLRLVPLGTEAGMARVATADVTVAGVRIRAGDTTLAARAAAARDETVYPDPNEFRLDRTHQPQHLAFGYGAHYCLGAHLARLELQIAIGGLLRRFGTLRLAVPEEDLVWKQGLAVRGLRTLPLSWGT